MPAYTLFLWKIAGVGTTRKLISTYQSPMAAEAVLYVKGRRVLYLFQSFQHLWISSVAFGKRKVQN
jgi:hypothetical protein